MTRWNKVNLKRDGDNILSLIKAQSWFPYRTGNLKYHATNGWMYDPTTYIIKFEGQVAPYVVYLEEGTQAHNIPNAFGRGESFGLTGKYGPNHNMFHPGSNKHKGFISIKAINTIFQYYRKKYIVDEIVFSDLDEG